MTSLGSPSKQCVNCNASMELRPENSLYCSRVCRRKFRKIAKRKKLNKSFICEQCGVTFLRNGDRCHKFRFCSIACRSLARLKIKPSRLCIKCEKILPKYKELYCSIECKFPLIECKACKKIFQPKHNNAQYCTKRCFLDYALPPLVKAGANGLIYMVQCDKYLKVGYTSNFYNRLGAIRASIPVLVRAIVTRPGSIEEEQEFHRNNKEYLHEYGGREWYVDSLAFRTHCNRFFGVITNPTKETLEGTL